MSLIKPRPYQAQILKELKHLPAVALFMGTGTGKTFTSLFKFDEVAAKKVLIICPIPSQWVDAIKTYNPKLKVLEFKPSWVAKKKNEKILCTKPESYDIIVTTYGTAYRLGALKDVIGEDWFIIVDESHKIKEQGTKRKPVQITKFVLELGELTPYKAILTATPTQKEHGGYVDYYTQLKFLGYMSMSFKEFKDRYCIIKKLSLPGRPYPIDIITGYKNTDELDELLRKVSRRYVSSFGEYEPEHIKVNIPRAKAYPKTVREMVYKKILLKNVSRKRYGLKTLTSGRIVGYDEYDELYQYDDNNHKIKWLEEFLSNTDEPVAICYMYNVERDLLQEMLERLGKRYVMINGKTKDKFLEIKQDFDVVLLQYAAASESLDGLQYKCHIMVDYAMPESSTFHTQSIGRIDRDGQKQVPMYYYLVMEKTIDEDIYKMIKNKVEFSEEVLNKLLLGEE